MIGRSRRLGDVAVPVRVGAIFLLSGCLCSGGLLKPAKITTQDVREAPYCSLTKLTGWGDLAFLADIRKCMRSPERCNACRVA